MLSRSNLDNESWRIFSLQREIGAPRDEHGRVLAKSINGNHFVPIVSENLYKRGFQIAWPGGKRFAVCLTHDVDWAYPPSRHVRKALEVTRSKHSLGTMLLWRLGAVSKWHLYNPYSLRQILKIEEEFSATSSFLVKATPRELLDEQYEEYYDLEFLAGELSKIIHEGWEVGLHGGYRSHDKPEALAKEKATLESVLEGYKVTGVRMHYLRFTYPSTWLAVEAAGFKYDTTLAFPDSPGFRNGMCYPFKPVFDDREITILEIPLTVMDTTFWGYMHIQPQEAFDLIKKLAVTVEKIGGILTILWHNNTFSELLYGEWSRMYRKILSYFKSRGAWLTNCLSIYEHWLSLYG